MNPDDLSSKNSRPVMQIDPQPVPANAKPSVGEVERKFIAYIEEARDEAKAGSHATAMLAMMQAFATAAEAAAHDESPSAQLFRRKAELEEACNWPAVLALQEKIVRHSENDGPKERPEAPAHYAPVMAAKAWEDLAGLQPIFGQPQVAWESAAKAVRYAKQSAISPLIVTALRMEAHCLLKLGRGAEARDRAEESIQANESDQLFGNFQIARSRILLARCLDGLKQIESARAELKQAWSLLEQPGFHREIMQAEWREVEADLEVRAGNRPGAIATLEAAVRLRRVGEAGLMCGHVFAANRLAGTLSKLADLLEQSGDNPAADARRRDAADLLLRFRLPTKA